MLRRAEIIDESWMRDPAAYPDPAQVREFERLVEGCGLDLAQPV
jgi:hypothetical protein